MPEAAPPIKSWASFFRRSSRAIFVISGRTGRLRYVNPAWEVLTGKKLAQVRGTKLATQRQSVSRFWRSHAPPTEALAGQFTSCRRAVPPHEVGPPWWQIDFLPLPAADGLLGIIGTITPIGEALPKGQPRWPDWLADLQLQHAVRFTLDRFTGTTLSAQRLVQQARLAATHLAPIWLQGEPGTGKRTLAHAIHNAGPHADRPFLAFDAQALKSYLLESLLFSPGGVAYSHQPGAVYFREATRMPQELQVRLLNWANRPDAPRFFFGSTQPLEEALQSGIVLPTYYMRFACHQLQMLNLRDELADLPRYVAQLLADLGQETPLPESLLEVFRLHQWPGNWRELRQLLHQLSRTGFDVAHLPHRLRELQLHVPAAPSQATQPLDVTLARIEDQIVRLALRRLPDKPALLCDQLGITRARLNKIIARLNTPSE